MTDKSPGKELAIGFGLGFLTNLVWALVSERFDLYLVALIFAISMGFYYLTWMFILKPLRIAQRGKIRAIYDLANRSTPYFPGELKAKCHSLNLEERMKYRVLIERYEEIVEVAQWTSLTTY